jgi:hypothetical protein
MAETRHKTPDFWCVCQVLAGSMEEREELASKQEISLVLFSCIRECFGRYSTKLFQAFAI